MSLENNEKVEVPSEFVMWSSPAARTVEAGAERSEVPLPEVPLPIKAAALVDGEDPSDNAIGEGVYDYLRQFPDCEHNQVYAELLKNAYSHYLADLGSQILMLEHKEVDSYYIRRKISYMKILSLLDRDNPNLLQRLGIEYYQLGMMFSEFVDCRLHLLAAMGYFQRALKALPENITVLNYLGQIDYLFGDYPSAARRWNGVISFLEEGGARSALLQRVQHVEAQGMPDHPLVEDLERVGQAMVLYGSGEYDEAKTMLEVTEEAGFLTSELPLAEFYYLLGMCRGKSGDSGGAFESFEKALEIDPEYAPAIEAREQILDQGKV